MPKRLHRAVETLLSFYSSLVTFWLLLWKSLWVGDFTWLSNQVLGSWRYLWGSSSRHFPQINLLGHYMPQWWIYLPLNSATLQHKGSFRLLIIQWRASKRLADPSSVWVSKINDHVAANAVKARQVVFPLGQCAHIYLPLWLLGHTSHTPTHTQKDDKLSISSNLVNQVGCRLQLQYQSIMYGINVWM